MTKEGYSILTFEGELSLVNRLENTIGKGIETSVISGGKQC